MPDNPRTPESRGALAAEIDKHWLASPVLVERGEMAAACSCGEWRWVSAQATLPRLGEHFLPFSEHVAAAIIAHAPLAETLARGLAAPDREAIWEDVRNALEGIDATQTDARNGWWETSKGAAFGKATLAALRAVILAQTPEATDAPG